VDIETLEFLSNDYGLVVFEKIAGQILGDNGQVKAWCVNLNISSVAKKSELWAKMAENLGRDLNWSRYAKTYDRVISEFSEYKKLLDLVVKKVGPAPRVADLGCGTGNVTIRLLEDDIYRTVLAIDKNESMLDALQRKLDASSDENRLKERATLYKGGITNCLREQGGESFDACVMLNVLFALDNPAEALAEVYRVLSPNGVLALSTSHHETNISALFKSIQQNLVDQGKWSDAIEVAWMDAYQRNSAMEAMITRDSKDDIQNYITTAGFRIDEYHEDEYVNCVVVIKAVKVG
jgi:ubiquinone/menaquinone biosynthesis C-methylase UbiE